MALKNGISQTEAELLSLFCFRYMCCSIMQRAMVAPAVWIVVTLLDGKCLICAFSGSVDPKKFVGFANATLAQAQEMLSRVPCKEDELMRNSTSRRAVSRYLRCWSQVGGCQLSLMAGRCSGHPLFIQHSFAMVWLGSGLLFAALLPKMPLPSVTISKVIWEEKKKERFFLINRILLLKEPPI